MPRPAQVHLTPYETGSGTRFKLRWKVDRQDNQEWGFDDIDRAKLRKIEIEGELLRGQTPLSAAGRQKLCEFAEFHFTTATWLKPQTKNRYRSLTKLNINATLTYPDPKDPGRTKTICLGDKRLKTITYDVVEEWVWAVEQTRGQSERAKAYRCLSGIMSRALKLGEISTHPCQVKGASAEVETRRPSVDEDVPFRLAEALRDYTDAYGRHSRARYAAIPIFVGYGTGNRKSEIRGLRRRDIKLGMEHARIEIERQAYYVPPRERADGADSCWDEDAPTKTKKGKRTIWIEEVALEALRQHMAEFMRPEDEDPDGNDLVFTGPHGGPISDTTWDLAWRQARADAKVHPDLHLHDLRHHAATALAEDVKDIKHIQDYLGDSTIVAAQRYLDVTDEHRRNSGRAMGRRFARYRQSASAADVVPIRQAR
jgi:integrase